MLKKLRIGLMRLKLELIRWGTRVKVSKINFCRWKGRAYRSNVRVVSRVGRGRGRFFVYYRKFY